MSVPPEFPNDRDIGEIRSRIIAAAAKLIASGGSAAATTRAVAAAAAVQAPTIYRLFGDKQGLLDAVAAQSLSDYVAAKARREPAADAIEDLHDGWVAHVTFGLTNPSIFALINTARPGRVSSNAKAGLAVLRQRVRRVARMGRLRVSEERAVDLIQSMGTGTVLTLLAKAPEDREGLSDAAWNAVVAAIIDETPRSAEPSPAASASALRAVLDELAILSPGERHLIGELLLRIAHAG